VWTSYPVLKFCGEIFLSLQGIQSRSLGSLTGGQSQYFKKWVCLNSMQHKPSSEPAISSASQHNPGSVWNQKIHHRVQNSQQLVPIRAKLITSETSDNISWRSILILFFHRRLGLASDLLPLSFLTKTLYVFLFSWYAPQVFPLRPSFI